MVVIDHLKIYVIPTSLPSGSSAQMGIFFIHLILLKHGSSRVLLSEPGRPFLAQLLQEISQPALSFTSSHPATTRTQTASRRGLIILSVTYSILMYSLNKTFGTHSCYIPCLRIILLFNIQPNLASSTFFTASIQL